jgi:23S rRNA pseudouridine1911/1915/1917 synthase
LLVHPKKPGGPRTLWDELRGLLAFELANGGQVSLVNRLDRETSGLVLVAKTAAAARCFHMAMAARAVEKEYEAIVWGWPKADEFSICAPILRRGERFPSAIYLKRCIHPDGAKAETHFRVLRCFMHPSGGPFALVRAFPKTGRTHQIRLHLSHAGHPIVGDKIYGPDERCYLEFIETGWTPALERRLILPRHALHSTRLRVLPGAEHEGDSSERLDWHAPLAEDLARWMGKADEVNPYS